MRGLASQPSGHEIHPCKSVAKIRGIQLGPPSASKKLHLLTRPAEGRCGEHDRPAALEARGFAGHFVHGSHLLRIKPLPPHSAAETRIVEPPTAHLPDPVEDLLFLVREMLIQPAAENVSDGARQA